MTATAHKIAIILYTLARHPKALPYLASRFHVHFTPTYGSWINLIERWFAELHQQTDSPWRVSQCEGLGISYSRVHRRSQRRSHALRLDQSRPKRFWPA